MGETATFSPDQLDDRGMRTVYRRHWEGQAISPVAWAAGQGALARERDVIRCSATLS